MNRELTIGELIKRFIKLRGRTLKEVAAALDKNYKTLSGVLNRNAVDAELLFELANLLDIDLAWMSQLFDHHRTISFLEKYQMPRMQREFREHEYTSVVSALDACIQGNPDSITDVRHELMQYYKQLFYLLDVLLPEDYIIRITVERDREKYYCISLKQTSENRGQECFSRREMICEGNEKLSQLIQERKINY